MLRIDIHIPKSVATGITLLAMVGAGFWMHAVLQDDFTVQAEGGQTRQEAVQEAEADVQSIRTQQAFLSQREEILRYQLLLLQEERRAAGSHLSPAMDEEFHRSEEMLQALLRDQKEAERLLLISLQQLWQAEGRAIALTKNLPAGAIAIVWPVEPTEGISAGFDDVAYEERFGIPHRAIDIPVLQGTVIVAAADGIVEDVTDNGLGFNSLTLSHNGYATLYGHVESFLVEPGQVVRKGDPIALSGGRPGTPGAGHMSTGPHVHFEVIQEGLRVDPMLYLPN